MDAVELAFVALAIALLVGALAWFGPWFRSREDDRSLATREPRRRASDRSAGPTGDPYPPGSRPAGPGAEGMRVEEAGEISPGPEENPPAE
jgi:hypothetical protein